MRGEQLAASRTVDKTVCEANCVYKPALYLSGGLYYCPKNLPGFLYEGVYSERMEAEKSTEVNLNFEKVQPVTSKRISQSESFH